LFTDLISILSKILFECYKQKPVSPQKFIADELYKNEELVLPDSSAAEEIAQLRAELTFYKNTVASLKRSSGSSALTNESSREGSTAIELENGVKIKIPNLSHLQNGNHEVGNLRNNQESDSNSSESSHRSPPKKSQRSPKLSSESSDSESEPKNASKKTSERRMSSGSDTEVKSETDMSTAEDSETEKDSEEIQDPLETIDSILKSLDAGGVTPQEQEPTDEKPCEDLVSTLTKVPSSLDLFRTSDSDSDQSPEPSEKKIKLDDNENGGHSNCETSKLMDDLQLSEKDDESSQSIDSFQKEEIEMGSEIDQTKTDSDQEMEHQNNSTPIDQEMSSKSSQSSDDSQLAKEKIPATAKESSKKKINETSDILSSHSSGISCEIPRKHLGLSRKTGNLRKIGPKKTIPVERGYKSNQSNDSSSCQPKDSLNSVEPQIDKIEHAENTDPGTNDSRQVENEQDNEPQVSKIKSPDNKPVVERDFFCLEDDELDYEYD
jgi:hypothetical protein